MNQTKMIPLESVMSNIYISIKDSDVKQDLVMEYLINGLELLSVYNSYEKAISIINVENNQADYPECMLGIEYILYQKDISNSSIPSVIKETISSILDINGNRIGNTSSFTVTGFTGLVNNHSNHNWSYLSLSNNAFDRSIICNDELSYHSSCSDWYIPDSAANRIITSFNTGLIMIAYYKYPTNELGQYLILNIPQLIDALTNYVFYKIFQRQWHNSQEGAQNKMSYYKQLWDKQSDNVRVLVNMPTMMDYYNMNKMDRMFKTDNISRILGGWGKERINMR